MAYLAQSLGQQLPMQAGVVGLQHLVPDIQVAQVAQVAAAQVAIKVQQALRELQILAAAAAGVLMLEGLVQQPAAMVDLEWLFCLFQQQVTLEL
jgi:hypothetical protein